MKITQKPFSGGAGQRWRSRGITILELLFGLVIVSFLISQAFTLKAVNDRRALARTRADNLAAFQRVASQYYLSNRLAMDAAMSVADPTGIAAHCQLGVVAADGSISFRSATDAALKTCAVDAYWLRSRSGVWSENLSIEFSPGIRPVAIFKIFSDPTDVRDGSVEMLTVLAAQDATNYAGLVLPFDQLSYLHTSRDAMGATGGFVPQGNATQCSTTKTGVLEACGNGWEVSLLNFISASSASAMRFGGGLP